MLQFVRAIPPHCWHGAPGYHDGGAWVPEEIARLRVGIIGNGTVVPNIIKGVFIIEAVIIMDGIFGILGHVRLCCVVGEELLSMLGQ